MKKQKSSVWLLIECTKDVLKKTNKEWLNYFKLLIKTEKSKIWKEKEFWEDFPEFEKYIDGSYNSFLRSILGVTDQLYASAKRIIAFENGEELFLKYGRKNMATYITSTIAERNAIIKAHETSPISSSFSEIKNRLFPKPISPPIPITNGWKKKYDELKIKYDILEKKLEKAEKSIATLEEAIVIMSAKKIKEMEK
mgnify:CR=1 FL=1|jgi:hypothetical protein